MRIFRSLESRSHKIVPRCRKKLWPKDLDGNPYIYNRGLMIVYKNDQLLLVFNIPEALTLYTSVSVDFRNLTTGETIVVSQNERKQEVVIKPDQRYRVVFIGENNPDENLNSQDKFVYEFEPDPKD